MYNERISNEEGLIIAAEEKIKENEDRIKENENRLKEIEQSESTSHPGYQINNPGYQINNSDINNLVRDNEFNSDLKETDHKKFLVNFLGEKAREYISRKARLDQYSDYINELEDCYININNSAAQIDENNVVTNQQDLLREGDLMLAFGNYEQALIQYKKILANRGKKLLDKNYIPQDEKLRQAAELFMELRPIIQRLDLEYKKKLDLYISSIAAHTQGEFSLTESEISDMIDKDFYYPSYDYDLT